MMMILQLFILLVSSWACCGSADENRLLSSLLIGYNRLARPVVNAMKPTHLKLGVSLREAVGLNEDLGQVTFLLWLKMVWTDEYMQWNPSEYAGIKRVYIPPDEIWTPDITLYNALRSEPEGEQGHLKLLVSFDGEVTWLKPVTYTVTCKHEFRGNAWVCPFDFGSWVYNADMLEIHSDNKKVKMNDDEFLSSDHFILLGHEGKRLIVEDKCCSGPFTTLNFRVKLRNLIGPALMGK